MEHEHDDFSFKFQTQVTRFELPYLKRIFRNKDFEISVINHLYDSIVTSMRNGNVRSAYYDRFKPNGKDISVCYDDVAGTSLAIKINIAGLQNILGVKYFKTKKTLKNLEDMGILEPIDRPSIDDEDLFGSWCISNALRRNYSMGWDNEREDIKWFKFNIGYLLQLSFIYQYIRDVQVHMCYNKINVAESIQNRLKYKSIEDLYFKSDFLKELINTKIEKNPNSYHVDVTKHSRAFANKVDQIGNRNEVFDFFQWDKKDTEWFITILFKAEDNKYGYYRR